MTTLLTRTLLCAALLISQDAAWSQKLTLNDGRGAYATKTYRNLFLELGHPQAEIDAKINQAFQQLFHGDSATQRVYFPVGSNENGPLAYMLDVNNNDIRSEGMSYGMMIAVQLDKNSMRSGTTL
jgi:oligosaccharide reducing-end xylanase